MKRLVLALSAIVVAVAVSSCAVGVRRAPTLLGATSATLNGAVLSTTGGPGSWYIEYGPTEARTERTPTRTISFEANEIEPVSEPVDGLEPGTTYHFAVCAEDSENPGDPFCSPDQTFTTHNGDSVAGRASYDFDNTIALISALSTESGQAPTGRVDFTYFSLSQATSEGGPVTCVNVSGNRATVGFKLDRPLNPARRGGLLLIEDNGTPGIGVDNVRTRPLPDEPTQCPPNTETYTENAIQSGDLYVHDAPAPSAR
jgi:hypothetical protein